MDLMNYNHLFYFWTVARQGSISAASRELRVSQPTISEQLRKLEKDLGLPLFVRAGRGLRLTDAGQSAFTYADQMFQLGREMTESLHGGGTAHGLPLSIGITRRIPALAAHHLIAPALKLSGIRLSCVEDDRDILFARLAMHRLDVVITNAVAAPSRGIRSYPQLLQRSGLTFFGSRAGGSRKQFPATRDGAPFLMPEANTNTHQALQNWFASKNIKPRIVGEFSESSLLQVFGAAGIGCFATPTMIERDIRNRYKVEILGRTRDIIEEFYAVTTDRRPKHPGVLAILEPARRRQGAG
jgi:LysR family transcriptional regulator, transcriptional activator of nhaA